LPDPDAGPWHLIGDVLVRATEDGIHLAGSGPVPGALRPCAEALVFGNPPARLPLRRFLDSLPAWQEWLEFPATGWLAGIHFVPASPRIHLELDGSLKDLRASLTVAYPDADPFPPGSGEIPSLPRLKGDLCEIRNPAAEANACRILQDAGFTSHSGQSESWSLSGEDAILPFLAKILPGLRNQWAIGESPSIRRTIDRLLIVSPKIDVIGSGDDWLDFRLHYQTDDGRILPDAEIRSLIRSGSHHRKLSGNRHLWVDEHSAGLLESLIEDIDLQQLGGHYSVKNCAAELINNFQKNDRESLNLYHQHSQNHFQQPATLRATLRPYQRLGSAWLADRIRRYGGALLADDMGLGKTIQTIALIEYLQQTEGPGEGPVLVIATTSLLGNWQAEFSRFAPGRRVRVIHGTGRDSAREAVKPGDVLITSYGTLARDLAWHLRQHYRLVVADEASLMRNPDTDHAKAVAKLRADYRIALTGTPVENSVRDLWSIFRFIQPGWLGSREHFRERYELPLAQPGAPTQPLRVLQLKTSPFILRRTKQQVAPELPGKLEIDEFCELSRDQAGVYREILAEGRRQVEALSDQRLTGPARMRMLTVLLRLRQACCDLALLQNDRLNQLPMPRRSAKMERLMILLEEAREGEHRTLVFSQFSKQLQEIEKCVQAAGMRHLRLDGQTRNRQELVDRFQDSSGPEVFLISLKAGGYGLNLTAADTVIHFDPWWNPAVEAQATDRAHRIGQTRPVTVYRLLTRGTVEEKVLQMQSAKRDLARAIDEAGGGDPPTGLLDDPRRLRELFEA
ncbi:MAG: DEAD/DEAH box helicase, partial [Luteolibacter sp.]